MNGDRQPWPHITTQELHSPTAIAEINRYYHTTLNLSCKGIRTLRQMHHPRRVVCHGHAPPTRLRPRPRWKPKQKRRAPWLQIPRSEHQRQGGAGGGGP